MGHEKYGLERLPIEKFDKGYFPNVDFDDVPDGGSSDCKHVIYERSSLRKMWGMDRVNSSAASETAGLGLHFLNVSGVTKRVAVFGSKFYEDVSGTLTDRTGAITLTAGNLCQMIDHQQGSNKYLIGVNGVDAPFKWTGSGNAAVLAGSPPIFTTVAKYHNFIWGAVSEIVYFSGLTDPETWDTTKWTVRFNKNVVRLIENGQKLAVLMSDHIGSVSGYSYLNFQVEEKEIKNFGCVGRLAACNAQFGENHQDVIATLSKDGLYIFDEAFNFRKIFGDNYFHSFAQASLSKAVVSYNKIEKKLFVALPTTSATENDYLIVVDMVSGAFWPCPSIHANYIKAMDSAADDSSNEFIYFIDNAGYMYKFNRETINYHSGSASQAIDARWKSKKYNLEYICDFRDVSVHADVEGDWDCTVTIYTGLGSASAVSGSMSLLGGSDLLGSTFTLGASTLGGNEYVFDSVSGIGGFGRYFSISFENNAIDEDFHIRRADIVYKKIRLSSGAT